VWWSIIPRPYALFVNSKRLARDGTLIDAEDGRTLVNVVLVFSLGGLFRLFFAFLFIDVFQNLAGFALVLVLVIRENLT
jgi:hypothetical protein